MMSRWDAHHHHSTSHKILIMLGINLSVYTIDLLPVFFSLSYDNIQQLLVTIIIIKIIIIIVIISLLFLLVVIYF